ncbi:putative wd40 protein [Aspergillus carlsbadensis]|nr:putative wd40 protein [Aspergillus carlsbadensis]
MSDPGQYTVGWICALETEYVAARAFLDTKHDRPEALAPNNNNPYTLGEIGGHHVVIAVLPGGEYGTSSAAVVARDMVHCFPNIRFGLMVGIGGGAPSTEHDIRLGDIVVSLPRNGRGGLVQYDFGKDLQGQEFQQTGFLNQAPPILRGAVSGLRAQYEEEGHRLKESIQTILESNSRLRRKYAPPPSGTDMLFESSYTHSNPQEDCTKLCDSSNAIQRPPRTDEDDDPAIHYGLIASGNRVIKNAIFRDRLAAEQDILCFEMEAAGLMNHFPCLVIRGICDYSDSHKHKEWQGYAAMVAAAYAKDLLCEIVPQRVRAERKAIEVLEGITQSLSNLSGSVDNIQSITTTSAKKIEEVARNISLKELPIAEGAEFGTYMDQHEEECLPGTRENLLRKIEEWAVLPDAKCMFWLNGLAGTGKSTISRTVTKRFQQNLLGASFFFKRGEGDRGNATRFFPTIARQLSRRIPELRALILQIIKDDPGISMKPFKEQFEQLIYKPLCQIQRQGSPLVVVIDALDECDGENDIRIILQQLPRAHEPRSVSLRFFITSRPELPVRLGFQAAEGSYQDLILHEIPAPVIQNDLSLFLEYKLVEIRKQRGLSADWPGESNLRTLLFMSIPLFIFAATICRVFNDDRLDPEQSLREILAYQNVESKLGRTYLPVLERLVSGYEESRQLQLIEEIREVLGTILLLKGPLSVVSLSKLTGLTIRSVRARLSSLHSVLDIPDDITFPVRIFHLSFRDFLLDPCTRAKTDFWIDEQQANVKLANSCLSVMRNQLKKNVCNLPTHGTKRKDIHPQLISDNVSPELQYACRYWIHHVAHSESLMLQVEYVVAFLEVHFLHWLEVMSILGLVSEVIGGIVSLKSALPDLRLAGFLDDAKRLVLKSSQILDIAPLQIYASALLFAPKNTVIRRIFEGEIPCWVQQWPTVDESWGPDLLTLEGHSGRVISLAFSPNSQLLGSGSENGTIKIWDTATGILKHSLEGHANRVHSVAFSPNGQHLISGSLEAIRFWDPATGMLKHTLLEEEGGISALACSPDGQFLASAHRDGNIKIRSLVPGALEHTVVGHLPPPSTNGRTILGDKIFTLAYSPDGRLLAAGLSDAATRLWDPATGALTSTLKPDLLKKPVVQVSFSPDGLVLAAAHHGAGIRLWDPAGGPLACEIKGRLVAFSPDGEHLASGHYISVDLSDYITGEVKAELGQHSGWVYSVTFSPDGQLLASGASDDTIKLWDPAIRVRECSQERHSDTIESVAFSPDGQLLASCAWFRTIKVWELDTGTLKGTMEDPGNDTVLAAPLLFSLDSKLLASGSNYGTVRLWEAATGKLRHVLVGHRANQTRIVASIAFSQDGQLVAASYYEHCVDIWDITIGTLKHTLTGHTDAVSSVAFSPNGQTLASSSKYEIHVWDVTIGALKHTLKDSKMVESIAFSPNGLLLASGTSSHITLWDAVIGAPRHTIENSSDYDSDGEISESFSYLATKLPSFIE